MEKEKKKNNNNKLFIFYLFGLEKKKKGNFQKKYFFTFIPSLSGEESKRLICKIIILKAIKSQEMWLISWYTFLSISRLRVVPAPLCLRELVDRSDLRTDRLDVDNRLAVGLYPQNSRPVGRLAGLNMKKKKKTDPTILHWKSSRFPPMGAFRQSF